MTTKLKQRGMAVLEKNIFPVPLPITGKIIDKIKLDWVADELATENETIAALLQSYQRLVVAYHIAKAGGTATHSGSFEHCNNKTCKENRKILESIKPVDPTAKPAESTMKKDAEFMAHVWQMLRENDLLSEAELTDEGGDIEGVDFVANRILGLESVK